MVRGKITRRDFALGGATSLGVLSLSDRIPLRLLTEARAQGSRPIVPRRLFFESAERSWLRLSPNGTKLAWLAPVDGIPNLWVAPVDDIGQARPVTRATDRAIGSYFAWAWNDRHIVFFRERDGDENWRAASVDIETGTIVPLTPEQGVRSGVWARDPKRPTEMLLGHNARDKTYFDLFRIDIVTGRSTPKCSRTTSSPVSTLTAAFNMRFASRARRDGSAEILQRMEDGSWASFVEIPLEDRETTWIDRSRPIGRRSTSSFARSRQRRAVRGGLEDRGPQAARRGPRGRYHRCRSASGYGTSDRRAGQGRQEPLACHRRKLPGGFFRDRASRRPRRNRLRGISSETKRFYCLYRPRRRFRRVRALRAGERGKPLAFPSRPKLDNVGLRPMLPVSMPARDGLTIPGYLTLPSDDFRNGPLMLVIHGGPYWRDSWGFNSNHQWLANRGYAVLSVNYRGSTGFGKAFVNAADREWGGRMHDDLIDAVEWAVGAGHRRSRARRLLWRELRRLFRAGGGDQDARDVRLHRRHVRHFEPDDLHEYDPALLVHRGLPSGSGGWRPRHRGGPRLPQRALAAHPCRSHRRPFLIGQGMNDVRVVAAELEQIVARWSSARSP